MISSEQNLWNVVELLTKSKEPKQLKMFHLQADVSRVNFSFLSKQNTGFLKDKILNLKTLLRHKKEKIQI